METNKETRPRRHHHHHHHRSPITITITNRSLSLSLTSSSSFTSNIFGSFEPERCLQHQNLSLNSRVSPLQGQPRNNRRLLLSLLDLATLGVVIQQVLTIQFLEHSIPLKHNLLPLRHLFMTMVVIVI
ncbi:hypothetical protein ACB098_11G143500 [Castanea mollissima]